jgi:hypothetical protein
MLQLNVAFGVFLGSWILLDRVAMRCVAAFFLSSVF